MIKLEKLLLDDNRKMKEFGVVDIESANWIDHLVTGFYTKHSDGYEQLEYFYTVDEFLDFVVSENNERDIIFAHYGGKFDFLFLMNAAIFEEKFLIEDMIPLGSKLLCFTLTLLKKTKFREKIENEKSIISFKNNIYTYRARKVSFYDSSALLPFSLKSLTENFGVANKKLEISYDFQKVTPKLLEYLEYDLKGLYQVLDKFYSWPIVKQCGGSFTMASQALRVFRSTLKKPLQRVPRSIDEFVRKAYTGGRTEIFKPLFIGNNKNTLACFDVNSLYPTVMQRCDHIPGNFKVMTSKYYPEEIGFYDVELEIPDDMYVPPVGTTINISGDDKYVFPVGRFKTRLSTLEIEYVRSLGGKIIKTGQGALFHDAGPLFREYVDMLYKMRLESDKNSVTNVICKLLMNSLYGRFALNTVREKIDYAKYSHGNGDLFMSFDSPERSMELVKSVTNLDKTFTNVAISAWITAGARIHMHKIYLPHQDELYYTDTDSLFSTADFEDVTGLGGLKKEYSCDSACFLLPKTYLVQSTEKIHKTKIGGKMTLTDKKIVMKGFDRDDIYKFEMQDFYKALEGDLSRLKSISKPKIATFKTAIKKGNLLTMLEESTRQIRSHYDKRRIVKTQNGGYDTTPLVIRDGLIIN